jgi:aldehyde dehydrogenase
VDHDAKETLFMTVYASPGTEGSIVNYRDRYDHWIGGEYKAPVNGKYFENPSPVTGKTFTEVARGDADDIEAALDAAHAAAPAWGKTSAAERAIILNKIADRIEENLEEIAVAETWENGKPVRETLAADIPLAIDHFRYFAGAIRAQEGSITQIDNDTVASSARSSRGTSRSSWRCGSWPRRSPQATRWSSSPRSRPRPRSST